MTQINSNPSQTNPSLPLSPALIEKLAAATSVEEVKAVLAEAEMEKETPVGEETPNQTYARLRREFRLDLEGVAITRTKAAKIYDIGYATIADLEKKGLVRIIEKSRGQGIASGISERDVAIMAEMHRLFRKDGNKSGPIKGFKPPKLD